MEELSRYVFETVIIFDPLNYEDSVKKFKDMHQKFTGKEKKIKTELMGVKKLAYPIREKFTEGYYAMFTWLGTPDQVSEIERQMRIDDNVIKFMVVKTENTEDDLEDNDIASTHLDPSPGDAESEQSSKPDALDVLLGFAEYHT